jgi:transposase-like protein
LVAALAEMYIQGVSTRKVKEITEQLCGHEFSAATISRVMGQLDEELQKFSAGSGTSLTWGHAGGSTRT